MAQPKIALEPELVVSNETEAPPRVVRTGMTADEYFAMPETLTPHNLIEGTLYVSPSPFMKHQQAVGALYIAVAGFAETTGGEAILSPMDCKLADGTVTQPDVSYVGPERLHIIEDHVMGAPDLVIEVLSKGTRRFDRTTKLDAYGRNGVREAWLVDPEAETVTVYTGDGSKWVREESVLFGAEIPSGIVQVGAGGLVSTDPEPVTELAE